MKTYGAKDSRMDHVKFVENSLWKTACGKDSSTNFTCSILEYFVPYKRVLEESAFQEEAVYSKEEPVEQGAKRKRKC